MKVALMVHRFAPDFGGVEVTAELIARGLVERHGAEVTVVTHTREKAGDDSQFPFAVAREPGPGELVRIIREADVVFHNNPCLQFAWPQAFIRRPWLIALRTWITMPGEPLTRLERLKYEAKYAVVERADKLVANSSALAGHVRPQVEVIHNSYRDDVFFDQGRERPRDSIVFLGRLSSDKGIDLLLEALSLLRERDRRPRLTLVGDGDFRPAVESQIRSLGLGDQVVLTGRKTGSAINDELNRHALAVVPSRIPEPFGTVALECAAAGCVTLVAGHGGLPEAIGDAGPVFKPNSAEALADGLERLLTDDAYFSSFAEPARRHVAAHRDEVMVDRFHAALLETVERFEATRGPRRRGGSSRGRRA